MSKTFPQILKVWKKYKKCRVWALKLDKSSWFYDKKNLWCKISFSIFSPISVFFKQKSPNLVKKWKNLFCIINILYHRIKSLYPIVTLIPHTFFLFFILLKSGEKFWTVCLFSSNLIKKLSKIISFSQFSNFFFKIRKILICTTSACEKMLKFFHVNKANKLFLLMVLKLNLDQNWVL